MQSDISLIGILAFSTLLPFIIASGTCFIKFSIVFIMVRNAIGLQQTPSNMTLNGVALLLSIFVMMPVAKQGYQEAIDSNVDFNNVSSVTEFMDSGFESYRKYLIKYTDPDLALFFDNAQKNNVHSESEITENNHEETRSILSLLPAYALSEIKSAFMIGFYLYLPFVVIDLIVSSVLLALGMMMMSPVTISVPIKLILFVVLDGWSLLSKGLVLQYLDLVR